MRLPCNFLPENSKLDRTGMMLFSGGHDSASNDAQRQ